MRHRRAHRGLTAIFAIPATIALGSIIGLGGGLLGDGWWDVVAWLGLGTAIATPLWFIRRSRAPRRR